MIKRFICAVVLLVFCITMCFASYIILLNYAGALTSHLTSFLENVEDEKYENALDDIDKCNEQWQKYEIAFSIFLDHELFEDLSINLPTVKAFLISDNTDEACEKATECISMLHEIIAQHKMSFGNIL